MAMMVGGALLMTLWGAKPAEDVRPPAVAGSFYPSDPKRLTAMVDRLLAEAPETSFDGELVALLVPHAGYVFSGSVAATAFKHLRGRRIDTVILLGVAHRYPVEGAAIFSGTGFATPLGAMPIRVEAARWLAQQSSFVVMSDAAHEGEHSLEVELPFLQRVLPHAQIVPLLMGNPNLETCQIIADAVVGLAHRETQAGRSCLLIASSDLSHYPTEADAHAVDQQSLTAVVSGDPAQVHRVSAHLMSEGRANLFCTFCGEGAVKTVMAAARALGANRVTQLRYATSADAPEGDAQRVVGYGAVAFSKATMPSFTSAATPPATMPASTPQPGEGQQLLRLARHALTAYLTRQQVPPENVDPYWPVPLKQPAAVFVTLRRAGELRGCIGTTEAREPLGVAVQRYAIAAATQDPRFFRVSANELDVLTIEISILSPLQRITTASEIQPKRHGVMVRQGDRSGLFLPQVWEETGWSREQFLRELCAQKAGLDAEAWRDPATALYVFTVDVVAE